MSMTNEVSKEDYEYVDNENTDVLESNTSEIRIVADNAYHGVQLRYGKVSARVLEGTDEAELSFDLEVTNQDPTVTADLENNEDFKNYSGEILVDIITRAFENEEYRIGGSNDSDDNPAEPASQ